MAGKYHVRSISLPARSHPTTLRIQEEINKLKTWEASSTSTSESICTGLTGLEDLYICLDDLLKMASTQEIISHQREKCVDELLDGSVRLLDICSIARDIMLQIREHVHALQSALRRRKGDSSIESIYVKYTCFRKKIRKDSKKLIATLKQMDNKLGASLLLDQDQYLCAVIRAIKEVNVMSISIFQSLLFFLSTPVSKRKQSKWVLVSKLMHKGMVIYEENKEILNEFESVDAAISEGADIEKMQIANQRLEALVLSIEGFENGLESLFRNLIKARTSLLNIISQ